MMNPKRLWIGVAVAVAALAGCQKQEPAAPPTPKPATVEIVKESERSRSFLAVNQHLELGGTLYGYVDVDGDVQKLTVGLHELLAQLSKVQPMVAPVANQDLGAISTTLGLTDVKAVGVSSVPDGTGFFRNRAFFYTPGQRHGLLLGLGGKPGAFTHVNLAPADTSLYGESEMDLPVMYQTIKDVVAKVAGEPVGNQMESALKKAGQEAALSVLDLIYGLKGHAALVLRVDSTAKIQVPTPQGMLVLPSVSVLVCMDTVAPAAEPSLAKSPMFKRTDDGTRHVYEFAQPLPFGGIRPIFVIDGTTLYFATNRAFLDECRNLKSGLAQNPEFQRAVAQVGLEGNGITYVHPRLFDELRKIQTLNPTLPPQVAPILTMALSKLPKIDRPMVAIRTNLPDGILVRAYWDRSFKQDLAVLAMYNPMTIGIAAGMAIPAFQKVRSASQEKAVLNNLRQLSSAADKYYLEHGVTTVTYDQLVGPQPDKYIKRIMPVAGEDYHQLQFAQGQPLRIRLRDGRVVEYAP